MKNLLLFLIFFVPVIAFAQKRKNQTPIELDRFAALDSAFARVLKDWKAVGFAVAVVEKGKVTYSKGFGYRDFEKKLPATPNTLFAIGSCTKAFTASLLGLLQKDGKIDYDEPVRKYLPDLKFYNNDLNNNLTVRDMMCHRTGLPRHDLSWYFANTSRDSLMARIQYMEPSAPLRQRWQYNNFMFLAQGVLAEKLSGKSWEDNIREKIFQPLDMKNSVFSIPDLQKSSDASIGYEVKKDSLIKKMEYYNIGGMGPAGSINSSVNDMANWLLTWTNTGKFGGKEILPAAYITEAMSSQMVVGNGLPDKEKADVHLANYGFGWMLASYKGHYRVEHGGNIDGFSASTCFFPSDSVGIVVLVNQNGSAVPSIIRNLIADRVLGLKYFDWNQDRFKAVTKAKDEAKKAEKVATNNRKKGTKPSHNTADYAGIYANDGYGKYVVTAKGDSLFLQTKIDKLWLAQYHYDIFQPFDTKDGIDTTDKSPVRLQFNTGTNGDIESIAITGFEPSINKPLVFNRIIPPKEITADEMKKYVGDYELAGATLKTYIKGDKTLYLFVPGQPEYELVFVGKNKFNLKKMSGFSVQFEVNEKGEITALTSIQPNGSFKATRKK
jgi:CubicO group peptidase (beta-lactamase class C family)